MKAPVKASLQTRVKPLSDFHLTITELLVYIIRGSDGLREYMWKSVSRRLKDREEFHTREVVWILIWLSLKS